jgi:hypothetical protein
LLKGETSQEGSVIATCHQARRPIGKGSGVTTCPTAPDPPLDAGGLRRHHIAPGPPPAGKGSSVAMCPTTPDPPPSVGGLWHRHVSRVSHPPRCAHVFPRHLMLSSSWPHQARGADSTLNMYKTSHTWHMTSIKYVQDIDIAEQRQYGADLLVTRNGQTTVQGDSTPLCSETATVSRDPSTRCHTVHERDVAKRHDMAFIRSSTSLLGTPSKGAPTV